MRSYFALLKVVLEDEDEDFLEDAMNVTSQQWVLIKLQGRVLGEDLGRFLRLLKRWFKHVLKEQNSIFPLQMLNEDEDNA